MYRFSRNYGELFDFIAIHKTAAGIMRSGDFYDGDIIGINRPSEWNIHIGCRGHSFASIYPFMKEDGFTEKEQFLKACEFAQIEWIDPIDRAEVNEEHF